MGFSVSAGKVMMRSTSALTSSRALRLSVPRSSSMVTMPMPSDEAEVIFLMPSTPCTASSTRMQTASSTSAGVAPR